jgi:hypothetical protein
MYNLDGGYPVPGAPDPKYVNLAYKNVCSLCFELFANIRESIYWKALHVKCVARGNGDTPCLF